MSIIIHGIDMPKNCFFCCFASWTSICSKRAVCSIVKKSFDVADNARPDECPILELKPHGRLIDADALEEEPCDVVEDRFQYAVFGHSNDQIRNAPTIIERDRH